MAWDRRNLKNHLVLNAKAMNFKAWYGSGKAQSPFEEGFLVPMLLRSGLSQHLSLPSSHMVNYQQVPHMGHRADFRF